MSLTPRLVTLTVAVLGAFFVFFLLYGDIPNAMPAGGVTTEVVDALEGSRADLKRMAQAEPERQAELHARFDGLQALVNRLRIVAHNQQALVKRQQAVVIAVAAVALTWLGLVLALDARRDARRLRRLEAALQRLAEGASEVSVADSGRDHIGTIARMIERTAQLVSHDRQRIASLRHLEAWQEAARRQAHELRTPLTVARLELDRMGERLASHGDAALLASLGEIQTETQRLERLVQRFATFARLPPPELRPEDAGAFLREFAATFAQAWPGLTLVVEAPTDGPRASFDRAMIRQVLVNLGDNSARALAGSPGTLTLTVRELDGGQTMAIDVADDGPGIAPGLASRLFDPYVTTAVPGQGMGLGLAISRKILLDHGGDLTLLERPDGATFRLLVPREVPCRA